MVARAVRGTGLALAAGCLAMAGVQAGAQQTAAAQRAGGPSAAAQPPSTQQGQVARDLDVVVRARSVRAAADAVRAVGGTVRDRLPIVSGVVATVPPDAARAVASAPGVVDVSPDRPMRVLGGAAGAGPAAPGVAAYQAATRVAELAAEGKDGTGSTVAVVDTGVSDVPELAGRLVQVRDERTGRVDSCYDLSGERSCADGYGHGTFLAGLIAGTGSEPGVAPGARVLSVKVAGRDGATDVSTVLAAIQWVVSFRDVYGIDVLNLSLGTDSQQSYRTDPLNYAVERAWEAGVVVVVAAGNVGPAAGSVTKPADDPFVLSVGAVDDRGTAPIDDDVLPAFSSRGPTRDGFAKPDIVAPGARLRSLRAPGSTLDARYPPAEQGAYRSGSGTSMSAAVVSGIAALVVQARPGWGPDEVKHALVATARPPAPGDATAPDDEAAASVEAGAGAGIVDAYAAAREAPAGKANVGLERSSGLGSLVLSRGSLQMRTVGVGGLLHGLLLDGLITAQLATWDPVGYTTGVWAAPTWLASPLGRVAFTDVTWPNGHNWSGHNWSGHNWSGRNWSGASFSERRADDRPYGATGPGSAWYGAWE
ncbi:S8 family serine peptidase [Motilibacter aurantiacus]|uniref:S8 family serine peptidase n=1 Tax=Motilibacter aurantiacus TaxID=2714955 RepID=UPI0014097C7F|nr:S8 family serine peptidase [Motilibacter aurantiacus]NHC45421.1 S8 family serine peptidase [Motilibacter aurantiacus]